MKKKKVAVEQLQEMAALSPKVEKYIQDNFPDVLKQKLEYNRWIKDDALPNFMVWFGEKNRYGFNLNGKWIEDDFSINPNDDPNNRYATPEEIKNGLIAECKKLGIWDVPIVAVYEYERKSKMFDVFYNVRNNSLMSEYGIVFHNGKFATPLVELTLQERIERIEKHLNIK